MCLCEDDRDFKEEMKKYLREIEENTGKKWNKFINLLKKSKEKAIIQATQIVQDLKTEIEAIKKTQAEGILKMENLSK